MHALKGRKHVVDIRNYGLAGALTLAPLPGEPARRPFEVAMRCWERASTSATAATRSSSARRSSSRRATSIGCSTSSPMRSTRKPDRPGGTHDPIHAQHSAAGFARSERPRAPAASGDESEDASRERPDGDDAREGRLHLGQQGQTVPRGYGRTLVHGDRIRRRGTRARRMRNRCRS